MPQRPSKYIAMLFSTVFTYLIIVLIIRRPSQLYTYPSYLCHQKVMHSNITAYYVQKNAITLTKTFFLFPYDNNFQCLYPSNSIQTIN